MTTQENIIIFREICVGIPQDKFCLDCLAECDDLNTLNLNDLESFDKAHPIVWAANVLGFVLDGDVMDISRKFCKDVLRIGEKKMNYLFGFYPYKSDPDKKDFLQRLFFITGHVK